jgi:hypothetical protein
MTTKGYKGGNLSAYVFGTHAGELPRHLVRTDPSQAGIFAAAPLSESPHNVYYALDTSAPDSGADELIAKLAEAGTEVEEVIVACLSEDCIGMVLGVIGPCKIPGCPEWFVFLVIEGRERLHHLEHARTRLGEDNVAAAYDGDGRFLVELAHDDRDLLEDVIRSFADLDTHRVRSTHWLRGEELHRV